MFCGYQYELWDGKKVIGHLNTNGKLYGQFLTIPTVSELKREYGRKYEEIKIPITTRLVSCDGIDRHMRTVLDVRRKSKRQIAIILGASR